MEAAKEEELALPIILNHQDLLLVKFFKL